MWRTVEADGCVWEVRTVQNPDLGVGRDQELLEFRPRDANRPPRRVIVDHVDLETMDESALRSAYVQARPIGGDYYGRPGKRMHDAG
jgi:hypothetical protein